eukprot:CAMPEP_0116880218 /NCGR_PEP_ID=MMETSP0463-20121206/12118_1 /TAXON_ID=181622 /ORGANISM="Strombidinopsis sp, Strain SopsisLIS2011" /LENGTH=56 /DNA_ID=CAMNT_0004530519 /DNA_START=1590 /DNA_END=1760 /DNA_ORIENTATION=-
MNNARKEYDDKYVERTFIGEELDEPDADGNMFREENIEENKEGDANESTTNILAEL